MPADKTILLVEDEALIALKEADILKKYGYKVITAYTGMRAIAAVRENPVDLVLMDIDLGSGKMDGTETAQRILKEHDLPIIFCTSHAEKEMVDRVKNITRYGYVIKNSGEFVLIESINMAFELFESQRELKTSEAFLDSIIYQSPISTWISDEKGVLIKLNDASRKLFGVADDSEVIGKYNFHKDDILIEKGLVAKVEEVFTRGSTFHFEIDYDYSRVKHVNVPGATHRILECTISPLRNAEGKITNAIFQQIDITEQKKTRERLLESREKYRSLVDSSPAGIIEIDPEGRIYTINATVANLIGLTPKELVGRNITEFFPEEVFLKRREYIVRAIEEDGPQEFWDEDSGQLFHHIVVPLISGGEPTVQIITQDMTRQKEIEGRYNALYEYSPVALWVEDFSKVKRHLDTLRAEGVDNLEEYFTNRPEEIWNCAAKIEVIGINKVALKLAGFTSKNEMLGNLDKTFTDTSIDMLKKELFVIWKGEGNVEDVGQIRTASGQIKDVLIRFQVLPGYEESYARVLLVQLDITARKEAEKAKDFLLKEMNHRIKNNLAMINSLISLKASDLGNKVDLSDLEHQIDAIRLVHDQLYQTEDIANIHIKSYIQKLLSTVFSSFFKAPVVIEKDIGDITMTTKRAISVGLIINEIATNSIKYGFPAQGEPRFYIELQRREKDSEYLLVLSNNGGPFPENIGFDNPETLGMRLIAILVEQIGGTISLERTPHPKFTIQFPVENENK